MKMPWTLYMAQLNEAGKLTARSIMDLMTVILEAVEEVEDNIAEIKEKEKEKRVEVAQVKKVVVPKPTPKPKAVKTPK